MKKISHTLFTMAFLWLGMGYSFAQQPEIVADINDSPNAPYPRYIDNIDGVLYYAISTTNGGYQLGKYDGTNYEIIYYADGYGDFNWSPIEFTKLGDDIYFRAGASAYGHELFKYDGTVATVVDINPGSGSSTPTGLTVMNNKLYFTANDGTNGFELWEYDGNTATMIEIRAGANGSNPTDLIVYNSELVFSANDGTNGMELWSYDGVTASMLEDINPGAGNSTPDYFGIYDNKLYMSASNEVWVYDGSTVAKLTTVLGQTVGTYPRYFTEFNGDLYFYGNQLTTGTELWKFDGTDATIAADINPGSASSNPTDLIVRGGLLYFSAEVSNGRELWKFDGTTATEFDLNTGAAHSYPYYLTVVGDNLYFIATTVDNGEELWMHDGTTATLIDLNDGSGSSQPRYLTAFGSTLFCQADDGSGKTMWSHNGTTASMITISTQTESSSAEDQVIVNGKVFFRAETDELGAELYSYDGTSLEVYDINESVDNKDSYPDYLTVIDDKLYFNAQSENNGTEMYIHDGTSATLVDIIPGSASSSPNNFTAYNGEVYFSAYDETNGYELWKYDGTTATMVENINPSDGSYPSDFIVYGSSLYFRADDGTNGNELWKYDGSTATLIDINSGAGSSSIQEITTFNGNLYFSTNSSEATYGSELWKYNGTTAEVVDINPGAGHSHARNFINYNNTLFFIADDGTNGLELWKYDGTTATLIDINTGAGASNPGGLTVHNNLLYFGAYTDDVGYELRRYDGTSVELVIDHVAGADDWDISSMFSFGPMLYINSFINQAYQLSRYNGTEIEFVQDMEVLEFEDYGVPVELDNYIYFSANSRAYGGEELWRIRKTSEATDIVTFTLSEQVSAATIDAVNHTVVIEAVFGTDISSLSPTITVSEYATINPLSGATIDFSSPVVFTVTSEFGNTQDWTISVSAETNDAPTDLSLSASTLDELNAIDAVVGAFTTTDPNTSDLHTYTLVAGTGDADNASFSISGSNLRAAVVFDYETKSSYSIRVQTNDGRGGIFEKEFAVTINNINNASQTISFGALSPVTFGDASFALTASSTSGLSVVFASSDEAVATVSGSTITFVGAGSTTITASQPGNDDYAAAVDVPQTLVVNKADQTITFNELSDATFGDTPLELSATSNSGLPVSFTSSDESIATISGNQLTIVGAGTIEITASQAGNTNYTAATLVRSLMINKASQTISIEAIEDQLLEAGSFTLTATASSGLAVAFELVEGNATLNNNIVSFTGLGTVTIRATQNGTEEFLAAEPVEQSFEVITVTGLEQKQHGIRVYPNPTTDYLTLELPKIGLIDIGLISIHGEKVRKYNEAVESIDLTTLQSGIYYLLVQSEEGTIIQKIIKK